MEGVAEVVEVGDVVIALDFFNLFFSLDFLLGLVDKFVDVDFVQISFLWNCSSIFFWSKIRLW